MTNKNNMIEANQARQAFQQVAMDARRRGQEAYIRGVETNHRLREAREGARAAEDALRAAPVARMGRANPEEGEARIRDVAAGLWNQFGADRRSDGVPPDAGDQETYNVYMDEVPAGEEVDGEGGYAVQFRVAPNSTDEDDPENNAVLANLNLYDLIDLRDAIQLEIDNFVLAALEA